jgi:hypothetical protein
MSIDAAAPPVKEALASEHAAKLREYMDICESLSAQKAELAGMLTNALGHIDAIHKAFGAPGDWGYGDVKGIALFDAIKFAAAIQAKLDRDGHNEMPERANG